MKPSRQIAIGILLLLGGVAQAKGPKTNAEGQPGVFDYYALALSWAPNFCASHTDPHECATGRQYGFVLHGLWPQYLKGYPQSCSTQKITPELTARYGPMFPSPGLIRHEWPKHGTCSGLQPADYFELTSRLKKGLAIPAAYLRPTSPVRVTNGEFMQAFKAANSSLAENGVLPFCSGAGRFLQEIHACYDKAGTSMSCSPGEVKRSRTSCGQESFLLQNVR
ncbi:MAG: ribonuclease [Pseudomonadota bacterium]